MKRKHIIGLAVIALVALALTTASAVAGEDGSFAARLGGFQEVPAISTDGHGTFDAWVENDGLHFTMSYWGLSSPAVQSHIHLGWTATNGGVSAFLCGAAGGDACPSGASGKVTVTGVIGEDDVIGPTGQGIEAGELEEILAAMDANATYVNVHTGTYPSGEIRGNVRES